MLVSMVLLAGGCGPNPPGESDGQGAGAAACLDAPMLLHAGSAEERPYAIPWADGRYLVGFTSPDATYNVLEPCSGDLEPVDEAIDDVVASDPDTLVCDDATGEVYAADALGEPIGDVITQAEDCDLSSMTIDGERVWIARNTQGGLHLFNLEGTYATVEAFTVSDVPWIDRFWANATPRFVVVDNGSMWVVDARTGAADAVASGVSEPFVRGPRVFFKSEADQGVTVYHSDIDATTVLPAPVFAVDCTLATDGEWYMLPPTGQSYCSRESSVGLIHADTAEVFDVPTGHRLRDALSDGEVLLVGDSVVVWTPTTQEQNTIWPSSSEGGRVPAVWGLNIEAVLVNETGPEVPRRIIVPLDGSEPFGLFGGYPSEWAYYGDGDIVIGITPDFELVRYDRHADELEVLAPKIVDAFYYGENTDRGHLAQLIYEVGDLYDTDVTREFWTMPLSE